MNNQRGSVVVFITLMIVVLMVMVGLGLDTGQLTYTRNTGQGAVDSAALAAVSALPGRNATEIADRAANFNTTNDYTGSSKNAIGAVNVSYVKYDHASQAITNYNEPIGTANGVRVALEGAKAVTTPVFLTPLMNLFGFDPGGTQNVSVSAVSVILTKPAIPIALWSSLCGDNGVQQDNKKIQMQHPTKNDTGENACWTTFLDCSSGANDIKALFKIAEECSGNEVSGTIELGTPICQNRGQVNSSLHEADDFFIKQYANRWWLVPVINGGGNCAAKDPAPIVNWAKIYPTQVDDTGNPKFIKAHITCDPTLRTQIVETNRCFSHRLVREPAKGM